MYTKGINMYQHVSICVSTCIHQLTKCINMYPQVYQHVCQHVSTWYPSVSTYVHTVSKCINLCSRVRVCVNLYPHTIKVYQHVARLEYVNWIWFGLTSKTRHALRICRECFWFCFVWFRVCSFLWSGMLQECVGKSLWSWLYGFVSVSFLNIICSKNLSGISLVMACMALCL